MQEYDQLAAELCISARADKTLPKQQADRVIELIGEIGRFYAKEDHVLKDHVWRLNYLFPQLLSESEHCRDVDKKEILERYAWNVQFQVSKIFKSD